MSFTIHPSRTSITRLTIGGIHIGVRHLDDGRALIVQLAKQLHDLLGLRRMQIAGWLVGEQQARAYE